MAEYGDDASAAFRSSGQLKFASFTSQVDPSFWFALSSLKLNKWKLDDSPQPTDGFYAAPLRTTPTGDGVLELNGGAFEQTMYVAPLPFIHFTFHCGI
jgi:Ubiquitin-like modifier-activating enzyme ATG7 N-terminus